MSSNLVRSSYSKSAIAKKFSCRGEKLHETQKSSCTQTEINNIVD